MMETQTPGSHPVAAINDVIRNRKMKPTEEDRLTGRQLLDASAGRCGHASWRALLALCSGKKKALLRIEFALDCPFGLHEEYAASLRAAGLEMRAIGLFDIVVGLPHTISSITGIDIEEVREKAILVRDVGTAGEAQMGSDDVSAV